LTFEKNSGRVVILIKAPVGQSDKVEPLTLKMGRGHESEVRVNDISVSRCHSLLKYRTGKNKEGDDIKFEQGFYLEDNLSKFGTLV
jgi:hypothetical protein